MLIQIHMLQNYAPSNLNRDDTGSPKDAFFGGTRRGRISSQCLKRSIRRSDEFAAGFQASELLGVRTKLLPSLVQEALQELGADTTTIQAIVKRVPEIGRESGKKGDEDEVEEETASASGEEKEAEGSTKQLIFLGRNEVKPLAENLWAQYRELGPDKWKKAKIQDITKKLGKSTPKSVDIAMFGRMTTSEAFEDVKAAVQIAHALSTHTVAQEFDYYTAVDDLSGESGAGMIGDVEFNSSTYYKYLNIHWEKLVENLGGDYEIACQAVQALLRAAVTAQPSGKQNSFAAHNLPDLVLVEVFDRNLPVSYANAFIRPAKANAGATLMESSIRQLDDYIARASRAYDLTPKRAFMCLDMAEIPGAEQVESLGALRQWLGNQLPQEG